MPRRNDSQDTTTALLAQKIDNLASQMAAGFKGVHDRQDYTNGKVTKAGEDIIELQKADINLKSEFKYNKVIWYFLTVAISVIVSLASYIALTK